MRILVFIGFLFVFSIAAAQTKVYLFPGQGADKRLFDSLQLGEKYTTEVIEYGCPAKHETMQQFAAGLLSKLDTTQNFILIGTSLGGMICVELSELCNPQKTIIISSVKNRTELPFRYRFQKVIPLYKIVPPGLVKFGAKCLQPIVEPDRNTNKNTFKAMLNSKSPRYMKATVGLIINWSRTETTSNIIHIHGTKDHTLPIRKIKSRHIALKNGSHMMTLTRGREISELIKSLLQN